MCRLFLVLALVAVGCSDFRQHGLSRPPEGLPNLVGRPVPAFALEDVNGSPLRSDELVGKVLVLDFWHLSCPPCLASAPILEKIHREFADRGLVVVGLNVRDDEERVREYGRKRGYTYRLACHPDEFKRACGVMMLPTFVIVDRAGIVRQVFVGDDNLEAKLTEVVGALLKE